MLVRETSIAIPSPIVYLVESPGTSVTVTANDFDAALPSASVAVTVTSYALSSLPSWESSWSRARRRTCPVAASMAKYVASAPPIVQVIGQIGASPATPGAGDVHTWFSATLASARPEIVKSRCSSTSCTVTVIDVVAVRPSASVALTVTS